MANQEQRVVDCRGEEGKTIGLIDAIITAAHLLVDRDLASYEVQEALRDLAGDKELKIILAFGQIEETEDDLTWGDILSMDWIDD